MSNRFPDWKPPVIEHNKLTIYNWLVQYPEGLKLGEQTDIGAFTYINAKAGVTIEPEVQIGSHCSIYSVSTIDDKSAPVILKRNCRIGAHCTVMPGVTIGENAVVGAHSFVNADVPANSVAYGVPTRLVRQI
jgi:acetyltransferase-like isoleucine patch superfamily enzyme